MPPAPTRLIAVLAAVLLLFAPTACGSSDQPALLNDLAARLDQAGDLTFTAEYRLDGGAVATLAQEQQPKRAAFVHPGGKAVVTETELATCQAVADGNRCTLVPPPSPSTDPALDLLTSAGADGLVSAGPESTGLVTPTAAMRLVSAAVLDGATVTRYDSTIVGEQATCVGVHGSAGFTACITARGLLGSFTGTVNGTLVAFELTSFDTHVDGQVFTLPPGAAIDDRRPR